MTQSDEGVVDRFSALPLQKQEVESKNPEEIVLKRFVFKGSDTNIMYKRLGDLYKKGTDLSYDTT